MCMDAPTYQFIRKKQKEKFCFFGFLGFFKVSERSGEVKCDLILHLTLMGFSSPHTLLKNYTFKHHTGQGESDSDMLYEHRSHA
jgi:hypothetical protein